MRRPPSWTGRTASALVCLALAACVPSPEPPPVVPPAPAPAATPAPAPVPTPSPVPSFTSWMDVPATPGDWTYAGGIGRFGDSSAAHLTLRCDRSAGVVEIGRAGTAGLPVQMIVRSELMERGVDAQPTESDPARVIARVPARDPLLDAMAFSKGRFAIEVAGLPTLYVPAWPEVSRVIEDCR